MIISNNLKSLLLKIREFNYFMEILEKDLEGWVNLPRFKNKKNFYAANNATQQC